MRKASSRFGGSVACGAIGLAAVQVLLANQAGAVPGLQRFARTSVSDSSTSKTVAANCPVGKRVLGGGGTVIGGRGQVILERLEPMQIATNDRFVVGAREDGTGFSGNWRLTAYALCADPIPLYGILPRPRAARARIPRRTRLVLYRTTPDRLWRAHQRRRRAGSLDQPGTRRQRLRCDRRARMPTALTAPGPSPPTPSAPPSPLRPTSPRYPPPPRRAR